jgi:spermidine/putrescine transport system permease protein
MAFTNLHVQLSLWVIVAGHVTFAIPYVALITRARLAMLNQQLEEAAMDLGATALKAIWTVVIPLLSPAIMGAAMLIFVFSFDDFTTSLFLSGVNVSPLPVTIFSMIRFGVSPEVNAFAVLVILFSVSLGIGSIVLARWRGAK